MNHMWLIVWNKIALNVQKRHILLVKVVILMHMASGAARDRCKQVRKCQNCGTNKCNDCKFQVYECDLFTLWWSLCLLQLLWESSLQQLSKEIGVVECEVCIFASCCLGQDMESDFYKCDSCRFFICKKILLAWFNTCAEPLGRLLTMFKIQMNTSYHGKKEKTLVCTWGKKQLESPGGHKFVCGWITQSGEPCTSS
jgi:hypothetical protein